MSGIAKWLQERIVGSVGSLLPAHFSSIGEQPGVSFQDCIEAYLKDPACKAFVDLLADQVVGAGFYTTAKGDYGKAEEAKSAVDSFCEQVNLDGLLQTAAREMIAAGNSFWEKIEPGQLVDLRILPLTSISRVKRDVHGNVEAYVQSAMYGGKALAPERIIHFNWNPVDGEPFGTGVLRPLLEKMRVSGETRMSFLEMKARIERMLPEIFEKYAGPDELWIFEGVSDERLAEYQRMIRSKPKAGARFIYNKAADVKTVQIDPRTQFQAYLDHILNQFYLGGETPIPKLFTTPGFTEASAKAAVEVAERKVMALQRFIKRVVEREVFDPIVEQTGYDPDRAAVRLNWGMPEKPEIVISDLIKAAELGLIRVDEFRSMMKKMGWELRKPEEMEAIREGFYYDGQGRLRFIPETPEQRAEYSSRVKIVRQHAKKFPEEKRDEVEKMLRKYRSRHLTDINIRSDSDEDMIRVVGDITGLDGYYDRRDKSGHIRRGHEEEAIHHEMGHFLTDLKFGTTRPPKYKKYLIGEYKEIIQKEIGSLAVRHEGEVLAEGFWFTMRRPPLARWLMRKHPEMREFFNEVMDDLGYRISGMRKRRR